MSGRLAGSSFRTAALAGCSKSSVGLIDVREVRSHTHGSHIKVSDYSLLIRAAQPKPLRVPRLTPPWFRGIPEPDRHTMEEATRPHDIKLEVVIWSPDSPNLN